MSLIRAIRCSVCADVVVPEATDGRFLEYKGVLINLPEDFYLPRCQGCRCYSLDFNDEKRLELMLQELYTRDADIIQQIFEDFAARRRA